MAKLRRNYSVRGGGASAGTFIRVALFLAIILGIIFLFRRFSARTQVQAPLEYDGGDYFLPEGGGGQRVTYGGYVLSYDEGWEQAEWVAYVLSRDQLQREWTERNDRFREDPAIPTGSASPEDYRGSDYDRGHLAPFADFAWDATLADETFLMSNVSPQVPAFNQGIWRELEEMTRDWAERNGRLYVVTGPVTTEDPLGYIGRDNRVAVPRRYFRVLLDLDEPEQKAIGFVLPNERSEAPLVNYVYPIDRVEEITGLDFFPRLMPAELEATLEARVQPRKWGFSKEKYDRRVRQWNQVNR
jgi:endonuclease G